MDDIERLDEPVDSIPQDFTLSMQERVNLLERVVRKLLEEVKDLGIEIVF